MFVYVCVCVHIFSMNVRAFSTFRYALTTKIRAIPFGTQHTVPHGMAPALVRACLDLPSSSSSAAIPAGRPNSVSLPSLAQQHIDAHAHTHARTHRRTRSRHRHQDAPAHDDVAKVVVAVVVAVVPSRPRLTRVCT